MRPNKEQNEMLQKMTKRVKRIALTILCTIPFLIVFAYLTRNIITNSFVQILCFFVIMGLAVAVVEVVATRREKRRIAKSLVEKDVFK